ncbi:MAG: hypothetical protein PHP44_15760 [Kiritimatiellae bacterium]|nr:hypothetical protein [Kiritimatiellia bacterium]
MMNESLPLGAPIVGSAIIRRERLMRRLSVFCAGAVGGFQAAGVVWLLALLYVAWLNPHRTDAIMLFAAMASAALLGASLFSLSYWFFDLRS